jgi:hypothetical protein
MNRIQKFCVPFLLTLALSRREREWQSQSSARSDRHLANPVPRFGLMLDTILPLPAGEGLGEGEALGRFQAGAISN